MKIHENLVDSSTLAEQAVVAETETAEVDEVAEAAEPSDESEVAQQLSMEDTTTRKISIPYFSQLYFRAR